MAPKPFSACGTPHVPFTFHPAAQNVLTPRDHQAIDQAFDPHPVHHGGNYTWIGHVSGTLGALCGGVLGGRPGLLMGTSIGTMLAVPLRRLVLGMVDPCALGEQIFTMGEEMAIAGGTAILLGGLVMVGMTAAEKFNAWMAPITKRLRDRFKSKQSDPASFLGRVSGAWGHFKRWYKTGERVTTSGDVKQLRVLGRAIGGHTALRVVAGALAMVDVVHAGGELQINPADWSLDHWWGYGEAMYSANLLYSGLFGVNARGLDVAAPLSFVSYQLLRKIAGADFFSFEGLQWMQALYWRYLLEFGNWLQAVATYGRAYLRPDLREEIANSRGLTATTETGTVHVAPFNWLIDHTLGAVYRHLLPKFVKKIIRPTVSFPAGPLVKTKRAEGFWARVAQRLTVVEKYTDNDMMKPKHGPAGRVLTLLQTWLIIVPWQMLAAPLLGMKAVAWGANRTWKFLLWSVIGTPVKAGLGGDTAAAQLGGYGVGLVMDFVISMYYNARAGERHWAPDLHESLTKYESSTDPAERREIAAHVIDKIVGRQMTDWSATPLGGHEFNPDYLRTFVDEVGKMDPAERGAMEGVFGQLRESMAHGDLNPLEQRTTHILDAILHHGN